MRDAEDNEQDARQLPCPWSTARGSIACDRPARSHRGRLPMLFARMPKPLPAPVATSNGRHRPNGFGRGPADFLKNRTVGALAPRATEAVRGSLDPLFSAPSWLVNF
jgi:hypothetical protein